MTGRTRTGQAMLRVLLAAGLCCAPLPLAAGGAQDPPPDPPTLEEPADGAAEIPANALLCVQVSDPAGQVLDVEFLGRERTGVPEDPFTLIALPDTQFYSITYPHLFDAQTRWIVESRAERKIEFVTQLGDCVHHGTSLFEWDNADAAMSLLEDPVSTTLTDGVPYGVAVGNHDNGANAGTIDDEGATTEDYNQYFGVSRFEGREYYGGHYGVNNDNHYELFSASGMEFIVIHLEYDEVDGDLRAATIEWADQVLKNHADRRAIVVSHYLLNSDGTFGEQGQAVYDGLKDNPNLFLMLCGHWSDQPRRTDVHDGNPVHTLLSNYQWEANGGNSKLRILRFVPADDAIEVETYSPWLDEYYDTPEDQFSLPYDMDGGLPFRSLGSVSDVHSGAQACVSWPGGRAGADYEWFVRVSDGQSTTTGPRWAFTSSGECEADWDCDDGDPCTENNCVQDACFNLPIPDCCESAAECDDGNPCTDDSCVEEKCEYENNLAPCSDGDACTIADSCLGGICTGDVLECDDGNACTSDVCEDGLCLHDYLPDVGCCTSDLECDDGDPCTKDVCDDERVCSNIPQEDCCSEDLQCQDSDPCTADICSRSSGAMRFDGSGAHVYVGDAQELNSAEFTVECWFKWDGGGEATTTSFSAGDWGGIRGIPLVAKGRFEVDDEPHKHLAYFLGINDVFGNVLTADFEEHGDAPDPGLNHPVIGNTPVTVGQWHHAAATYDGCCWQLYLDGAPDTDGTICPGRAPNFVSEQRLAFGTGLQSSGLLDGGYSGLMDEVRIWNRALGAEEIQATMHSPLVRHPDLIGRWALDEGAGYVTADSSGNGHQGALVLTEWESVDLAPIGSGSCSHPAVPGCCTLASDCDDANACTLDSCEGGLCRNLYSPLAGCCLENEDCDDGDACTEAICDGTGSCSNGPLDMDLDGNLDCVDPDDDQDGAEDCEDCAPNDPEVWDPPPEVQGLVLEHSFATILWWFPMESGVRYDVASGQLSTMLEQQGAFEADCLLQSGSFYGYVDGRPDPFPGQGYYYLVRAENVCHGSYGTSDSGEERLPGDPCP